MAVRFSYIQHGLRPYWKKQETVYYFQLIAQYSHEVCVRKEEKNLEILHRIEIIFPFWRPLTICFG